MNPDPKNLAEKPYNVCIDCVHIGKDCDGPNFLAMTTERWCEWCHLRKDYLNWTNAMVASAANLSEITVARVMSGDRQDLRVSTMRDITKALVNGSWGQYPCAAAPQENPELSEQCQKLQDALDAEKEARKNDIHALREYDERRLDYLKDQMKQKESLLVARFNLIKSRDRVITILSLLLGLSVLVIIAFLVADIMSPNKGFFFFDELLSYISAGV